MSNNTSSYRSPGCLALTIFTVILSTSGTPGCMDAVNDIVLEELGMKRESVNPDKLTEIDRDETKLYLVGLFFKGISNKKYRLLNLQVHNYWLLGKYFIPKSYNKVLRLEY